ncbi:hypothetical protein NC653_015594 [Populus alba x Populus x berolinensis]|uniref:Uncharacterized protein n=1 Tax=Populus alba x Populus x berolinensis TaxID=444605 RepID=A0AAD6QL98_9ROSI|nr:hypothetical protein NC653_015594 [Populus alba x Populus x berolinensis]
MGIPDQIHHSLAQVYCLLSSASASSSAAAKTGFRTPTSILPQVSVSRNELEALLAGLEPSRRSGEKMAVILGEVDHISVEALASRSAPACEPAGDDELRDAFVFLTRIVTE